MAVIAYCYFPATVREMETLVQDTHHFPNLGTSPAHHLAPASKYFKDSRKFFFDKIWPNF